MKKILSKNNATYSSNIIREFIRTSRKKEGLTQKELSLKAGVGLRFIRDIEQGKISYRADTINKVLKLFGKTLGPVDLILEEDNE